MRSAVLAILIAAATSAQAGSFADTERQANAAPLIAPPDYRQQVAAVVRASLRDPSSIADPEISAPKPMWMGAATRVAACVRFNARNGFGGMTGRQTYIAVFVGGRLAGIDQDETSLCRDAGPYAPFREAAVGKR